MGSLVPADLGLREGEPLFIRGWLHPTAVFDRAVDDDLGRGSQVLDNGGAATEGARQ